MAQALRTLQASRLAAGLDAMGESAARALGVDVLTVSLRTAQDQSEPLWCSDDSGHRFDDLQFTLGEGPARDAATSGASVSVPDVITIPTGRWSALAPEIQALPLRAIFCFPLGIGAIQVGVLTAARRTPGPLNGQQSDDAHALASALTARILDGPGTQPGMLEATDPPALLRAVVHQATGMLSVQLGLPLTQALLRLRAHAYGAGRDIGDISQEIVDGRLRLAENGTGAPSTDAGKD
ncbi:ANTAR domain-containing protein [Kitasatospora camelliae]|uniref:ANTAR domain-containing protein n=1 Tax=Kitasatospora camelliae TaxID=3156397 RepID=A0AAU8K8N3_9ACTN